MIIECFLSKASKKLLELGILWQTWRALPAWLYTDDLVWASGRKYGQKQDLWPFIIRAHGCPCGYFGENPVHRIDSPML